MTKTRLEAFSDGVIAILITIMVLELKVPHGDDLAALRPLVPVFLTYVLSFVILGIYWANHHHMLHATSRTAAPSSDVTTPILRGSAGSARLRRASNSPSRDSRSFSWS